MLLIKIEDGEFWDEKKQEFFTIKGQVLQLEHSLVSISKWESKWHKCFLSTQTKTMEETIDYVKCMTITQNVDPLLYKYSLTSKHLKTINQYIDNPMSAKVFHKQEGKGHVNHDVTSEDIYYYMVAYQIPFECQKWHFNRLMTLIKICNEKNSPEKSGMRRNEYARFRSKLNAARRAKFNTKG